MKKIILSTLILVAAVAANAQMDVSLKINHKLGVEDFMLDAVGTNNFGHEFKPTRLEYYVTRITIVHDGGMETAVDDDVIALVRPEDEISTTIDLGNFDVTDVEAVRFHIGVYEPINNADPALYDEAHPLAPKYPSMHWGWAAGYRFVAYHGSAGEGFSQNFQLHALGNDNYFEVTSAVWAETDGDNMTISLNGNYAAGLNGIDLAAGPVSHGETGDAKKVLENWRDLVFGVYTVGIDAEKQAFDWSVYPNPSNGDVFVNIGNTEIVNQIHILNPLGEVVQTVLVNNTQVAINIGSAGVYFVTLLNTNGETIASQRVVIK